MVVKSVFILVYYSKRTKQYRGLQYWGLNLSSSY